MAAAYSTAPHATLDPAELLKPIPGPSPGGRDLRYDPEDTTYTRIREARRTEGSDAGAAGIPKVADGKVLEVAVEALQSKSKDLQLAVWLTDSLVHRDGYAGLERGLELIRGLIELFWESLFPEIEDGDSEARAAPLGWLGNSPNLAKESYPILSVRLVPVTESGFNFLDYQRPANAGEDGDKAGGFEAAFNATGREFYERRSAELMGCIEKLDSLDRLCGEQNRFGKAAPSFSDLRATLEQIQIAIAGLLKRKPADKSAMAGPAQASSPKDLPEAAATGLSAGRFEEVPEIAGIEPGNRQEAILRIAAAARYLRRLDPADPAPYLVVRSLRWAELRARDKELDPSSLAAPAADVRVRMRALAAGGQWSELLDLTESAAASECGRGWLDPHRYAAVACQQLGYAAVAAAIKSALAALLADYPKLATLTLPDDTGTANPETLAWLKHELRIESR